MNSKLKRNARRCLLCITTWIFLTDLEIFSECMYMKTMKIHLSLQRLMRCLRVAYIKLFWTYSLISNRKKPSKMNSLFFHIVGRVYYYKMKCTRKNIFHFPHALSTFSTLILEAFSQSPVSSRDLIRLQALVFMDLNSVLGDNYTIDFVIKVNNKNLWSSLFKLKSSAFVNLPVVKPFLCSLEHFMKFIEQN